MAQALRGNDVVDLFEKSLIRGRAKWVADLGEFFRDYRIRGTTFDLYAKGKTRNRGFFLSRFFAWSVLPNYRVSLFCLDSGKSGSLGSQQVRNAIDDALYMVDRDELKWAWLILLFSGNLPNWAVSLVSRYDRKELGLAIASMSSSQLVCSNTHVGRSIGAHLGLKKLIEEVSLGKTN